MSENVTSPPKFLNPYLDEEGKVITNERTWKVQAFIPSTDFNFLKCIRPTSATVTTAISIFWKTLCNELRKRNITGIESVDEFELFVADMHILPKSEYRELFEAAAQWAEHCQRQRSGRVGLSDRSADGAVQSTGTSDVGGGHENSRNENPANASVVSDVQSGGGSPRKGTKGKKG